MARVWTEVCIIGHITKEIENIHGEKKYFTGGVPYFSGLTLKRLGTNVGLITKISGSDIDLLYELRREGVNIIVRKSQNTSRFETVYGEDTDERFLKVNSVADSFEMSDVQMFPKSFFYLGPLTIGDFSTDMVRKLSSQKPTLLDPQGFTRTVEDGEIEYVDWKDKKKGLEHVDIVKVDIKESKLLTGKEGVLEGMRTLSDWGPDEVILTSKEGVNVYSENNEHFFSPFTVEEIKARAGRGDTCSAAYLHARTKGIKPKKACEFSSAAASLMLSSEGPFNGDEREVMNRMENKNTS